jgi:hypothetical protein
MKFRNPSRVFCVSTVLTKADGTQLSKFAAVGRQERHGEWFHRSVASESQASDLRKADEIEHSPLGLA